MHGIIIITTLFAFIHSLPTIPHHKLSSQHDAFKYLQKYGYLDSSEKEGPSKIISFGAALKEMQKFAGLKQTGELDEDTIEMMNKPRCQLPDKIQGGSAKRYDLFGTKWNKNELTYSVNSYPSSTIGLPNEDDVDRQIAIALKDWSDVADLKFTKVDGQNADLNFDFLPMKDADGAGVPFKKNTLAYAFFPETGLIYFKDDLEWSSTLNIGGYYLRTVATHELGHALGLGHSNVKGSVMAPLYHDFSGNENILHEDDIAGMTSLYGKNKAAAPAHTTTTTTTTPAHTTTTTTTTTTTPALTTTSKYDYFYQMDKDSNIPWLRQIWYHMIGSSNY